MSKGKFISSALIALSLIILPSCKWFNKDSASCPSCPGSTSASSAVEQSDGSPVLLTVGGKPALTAKQFEDFIARTAEGNEQLKLWMQFVPDFKEQIFGAKKRAIVIGEWANKAGIHNTDDYRKKEKMIMDSIRDQLDLDEFIRRNDPEVTDAEAQAFYNENKDQDPRILISPAGLVAVGLETGDQNVNETLSTLRKEKGKGLEKFAKSIKKEVTKFEPVTKESAIDSKLKDKILNAKSFPTVLYEKDENGKNWIIVVKSKEQAKYRPFDQVKDVVKKMIKPKKLEELVEKEIPKLEKEFNVVEDKTYFVEQKKQQEKEAQEAAQAMAQMVKQQQEKEKTANSQPRPQNVTPAGA